MLALAASGIDASLFFQQIENGITLGAVYALVALGYTLVYGIIELINFAHGDVFMWSTIVTLAVLERLGFSNLSTPLSGIALVGMLFLLLAVGMVTSATLNFTIERVAYRRLRKAPRLAPLIAAIAASFILVNVARIWRGTAQLAYPAIFPTDGVVIGDVRINYLNIFIVVLALGLMYALNRFIRTTRLGRAMRATAQDPEAASLMGVNINRTISTTFIVGGALAGAGGVIYSLLNQEAQVTTGFQLGLIAFTAAVLGGIGNIQGAVLGGFLIGLIQSLTVQYLPGGFQWSLAIVFVILVLILVLRPSGLLGQQVPDKV
ncbi:MAG: branched-chain amino acid ABC transporter permease [Ktedonobacterales bacterium]|nr:branched-chain amino acid ABC transporter permease [Ktedonobacterales bacterium]